MAPGECVEHHIDEAQGEIFDPFERAPGPERLQGSLEARQARLMTGIQVASGG